MTTLYIDADACPVREEAYRVATRLGLPAVVVSNGSRPIRPPGLPNVRMVVVGDKPDEADDWIADRIGPADLCVTGDIPLASRCLARGARAHGATILPYHPVTGILRETGSVVGATVLDRASVDAAIAAHSPIRRAVAAVGVEVLLLRRAVGPA